jgi:hypothetical protein
MRTSLAVLTAGLIAPLALVLPGTAAAATCTTTAHTTTAGILTTVDGEVAGPPSAGKATLEADGVVTALPDATSKVQWLVAPAAGTKLADVADLRIRMRNEIPGNSYTASVQLQIDPDPTDVTAGAPHFTTLVWEAYKNGYGAISGFRTYDVDEPSSDWWSTKALPFVPSTVPAGAQVTNPFSAYLTAYPKATVLAYGWNIGKGSAGLKTTVAELKFATTAGCVRHTWAKPTTPPPAPAYTGPAKRRTAPIEGGRTWDHGNVGWVKPVHTNFEAELVGGYTNVAPAGTAARKAQTKALFDRNLSHRYASGAPKQPLIYLPATL